MRPTLLLIHGFPLDHTLWDANVEALRSKADVIAPDLPGFGNMRRTGLEATMESYAQALLDDLDERGVGAFIPCGLSMGGYVAMALVQRAPERMAGLVLCNTRSTADTPEGIAAREATARDATERGMDVIARGMVPKVLGRTTRAQDPGLSNWIERMIARQDPQAVAAASRGMAQRRDRTDVLRAFDRPALVITGAEDELMPLPTSQAMAEALPAGKLVVIESAGHLSNVERPDAFNAAVLGYLDLLESRERS
ncbi:MAG: alpha/beta fold hydrolase [Flavobacteriales bacterium]|nr:alpha/beta fold hydrolase [Flavobacteriales bacterium]